MSTAKKSPWFLSKEKTDRSNFWNSRSTGYSTSNYWLKDSIFDKKQSYFFDNEPTMEKESKYDHMQLAQYQRAISNFVRILTGRGDINVKYNNNGENYTDGKTITLSPNIKEKEFDVAVGLALHEGSHIMYSDFVQLKQWVNDLCAVNTNTVTDVDNHKMFANIVEDLYIDAMTYKAAPGYRGYYSALYQKYFGDTRVEEGMWSKEFAVPTWNNYMFHICNIRNPKRNLNALPGLTDIFNMLDLPNITRLSTMQERLDLAKSIWAICNSYIKATKEMSDSVLGTDMSLGGSGEGTESEIDYDKFEEMLEKLAEQAGSGDGENSFGDDKFVSSDGVNIQEALEDTNYVDLDKLSDKAKKALDKIFENQKQFVKGLTRKGKLSKADQSKVDAFASVDIEKKVVGANSAFSKKGIPLYIINNISESFIDSVGQQYGFSSYTPTHRKNGIEDGINRGRLLAKKLQLRNEERVLKTSRLDSGKIDKRLLHEIGFDNFDVFQKVNITSYKESFIHLSIDQSGSMGWGTWDDVMKFASMFAAASKFISNIHLVVSVRSTFYANGNSRGQNYRYEQVPYQITIFDSKKNGISHIRKFFPKISANGLTPEGLVFDGIMKQTLQMAQNKDSYFINICDGEPCYSYRSSKTESFEYGHDEARKHSNEQMKRMEAGGIKFITYFIGSSYDFQNVKQCYGDRSVHLEDAGQVHKIAVAMNKKLLTV
jgi:hypothetical protein